MKDVNVNATQIMDHNGTWNVRFQYKPLTDILQLTTVGTVPIEGH